MMKRHFIVGLTTLCVLAGLTLGWRTTASAQSAEPPKEKEILRVATRVLLPFVMRQDNDLTGFSIDLWRAIAAQSDLKYEFVVVRTLSELLDSVNQAGRMPRSLRFP